MKHKRLIIGAMLSGFIYAILGAGYDYSMGLDFRIWRFLFNLSFFGGMMFLLYRFNHKSE